MRKKKLIEWSDEELKIIRKLTNPSTFFNWNEIGKKKRGILMVEYCESERPARKTICQKRKEHKGSSDSCVQDWRQIQ